MWAPIIVVPTNYAWHIFMFTITNLAMVRNFDVISAIFNGYQTSRHHTTEDLSTEMNVVGIYVNRSNTQGPVKENELWRIRRNDELEVTIKGENIVRFIKCQTIRWLGHIERMQDTAIPKKDVVRKGVCNKTKRKTKNEMAG